MPTVNAGSSVTLTLSATDAYTVSTVGEAYVDLLAGAPGSPSESPRIVNGSLRFGPYGVAAQIRVRAVSGAADYATYAVKGPVLATAAEAAAFQSMVSGGGNASARGQYAAIGDSQTNNHSGPQVPTATSYNAATGVLTLTKSSHGLQTGAVIKFVVRAVPAWNGYEYQVTRIDANNFSINAPTGLSAAPTAADCRYSLRGRATDSSIFCQVQTLSGGRCRFVREAGVTGETWAQIRARIPTEIAPILPAGSTVVLQGGHNDTTLVALATSIADMQGCVSDLVALGLRVIILTITPTEATYGTTATRVHILEQNRAIIAQADASRGVAVADAFSVVNDPANVTLGGCNALTNYTQTDKLHWSGKATKVIAPLVVTILNSWYPAVPRLPQTALDCYDATNNASSWNKQQNALLATGTGGSLNSIAGAIGAGFGVNTTGTKANFTASVPASSFSVGNAAKLVWTSTDMTGQTANIQSTDQSARFVQGQKCRVSFNLKTTGLGGASLINYIAIYITATVDGANTTVGCSHDSAMTVAQNDQTDFNAYMESDVFYIPRGAALTQLYWSCIAYLQGTCVGTMEVSQVNFEIVP